LLIVKGAISIRLKEKRYLAIGISKALSHFLPHRKLKILAYLLITSIQVLCTATSKTSWIHIEVHWTWWI